MNPSEALNRLPENSSPGNPAKPEMRVFETDYICSLCQRWHTAETYIADAGGDLETLHLKGMEILSNEESARKIITGHIKAHHYERGDLIRLAAQHRNTEAQNGIRIMNVLMTHEDRFICDECGREEANLPALWSHMGRDPISGVRIGAYACEPR